VGSARALASVRREARACCVCPLWRGASQTVFGEGPVGASLMLVGEQPGDREDIEGHPFVGPAGAVLDRALEQAGIDRARTYTTNAVKHFKHRLRGTRRIHQRPSAGEVAACRPWLEQEIAIVAPAVVVALGATAAHSLFGRAMPVGASRGRPLESALFSPALVTAHPSSVLRERDSAARHAAQSALAEDLRLASDLAAER
jgi:uracil-DNA glycosylase